MVQESQKTKHIHIGIRANEAEYTALKEIAKAHGQNVSAFVRSIPSRLSKQQKVA
jgi:uncharacterized protein (DUF1778 family)